MTARLRIIIQTPALVGSRLGNRVTADRWSAILQGLGHQVDVTNSYEGEPADLFIAIHAWRSADAICRFRHLFPGRPIVVCLSGTDVYANQYSHPEQTLASLDAATVLVGLHDHVARSIPARFGNKLKIIYQSAPSLIRLPPARDAFDVSVICHLRQEKDPMRTAKAARLLPSHSQIRVTHVGRALSDQWERLTRAEMEENPRYHWKGSASPKAVGKILATTQLMALTSIMEGGANVLGEAIAAGVPVVTSAIEGSLGLLGEDFPGTFPVGDTQALAQLLRRVETDPAFLATLTDWSKARAPLFAIEREQASWAQLIADLPPEDPRRSKRSSVNAR